MTARFRIDQLLDHDRSTFSSGVEPLGQCLRRQASQDIKRKLSVCYGDRSDDGPPCRLLHAIGFDRVGGPTARKLPRYPTIPAARIGRLAVDRAFRCEGQTLRVWTPNSTLLHDQPATPRGAPPSDRGPAPMGSDPLGLTPRHRRAALTAYPSSIEISRVI